MPRRSRVHSTRAPYTAIKHKTPLKQHKTRENRPSARQRGYSTQWDYATKSYLAENPLCAECAARGRTEPATVTDHITPHRGNPVLFWERKNWQPLCTRCHNQKTARENGGFGNPTPNNSAPPSPPPHHHISTGIPKPPD